MTEKNARKPYRGDGVTVPAVTPLFLPPEPGGDRLTVQVHGFDPVFGMDSVWDRMVTRFMPRGWIATPASWAELCRLDTGRCPTVLEPREVAS